MKRLLLLSGLCLLVSSSVTAIPQDGNSLRQQIQEIVKGKRPGAKLLRKHEKNPKEVTFVWGADETPNISNAADNVVATVFYGGSKREAADRMKSAIEHLAMGPGQKRTDIGDEAYSWKSESNGFAGLRFRQANVYVELSGPSESLVNELAKSITELIPGKN